MDILHTMMIWPVQAPCQIAYRDPLTGIFWQRPYIDLRLKSKIWGVAINGLVFKLTHERDAKWDVASSYGDEKSKAFMPTTAELDEAYFYFDIFNRVVGELNKHRITAEPWRAGFYWSKENAGDNAVVMDMGSGKTEMLPKRIPNVYTRLVSRRLNLNKPINVGRVVAYWRNNRMEVANDLRLDLLPHLWGIAADKLIIKLTDEPRLYTWYEGKARAEQLSNSNVRFQMPPIKEMLEVEKYYEGINDTLAMISAYGAKVDLLDKRQWGYLTADEYGPGHFVTHYHEMIAKDKPCKFRLFAKDKNPIVI